MLPTVLEKSYSRKASCVQKRRRGYYLSQFPPTRVVLHVWSFVSPQWKCVLCRGGDEGVWRWGTAGHGAPCVTTASIPQMATWSVGCWATNGPFPPTLTPPVRRLLPPSHLPSVLNHPLPKTVILEIRHLLDLQQKIDTITMWKHFKKKKHLYIFLWDGVGW